MAIEKLEEVSQDEYSVNFDSKQPGSSLCKRRGLRIIVKRLGASELIPYRNKAERTNANYWIIMESPGDGDYENWRVFDEKDEKVIDGLLKARAYAVTKTLIQKCSPKITSEIPKIQEMIKDDGK